MRVLLIFAGVFSLSAVCPCLLAQEAAPSDRSGSQDAAEAKFVPAELSFAGAKTIADLIRFPDTEGDITVALHCALQARGRAILSNFCFSPDRSASAFEEAFRQVMPRLRVSTARLDGRHKAVWIPYSVEFIKRGDDEHVQIYENYGVEIARFGSHYTGPQRVLSSSSERVSRACNAGRSGGLVWVEATITANGTPEGVRVVTEVSEACREGVAALFAESSYIPAHYQGRPVSAELLVPFFPALHVYGSCNDRTHNNHGREPLHGLQDWSGSRRSPCYWDGYAWHKIS